MLMFTTCMSGFRYVFLFIVFIYLGGAQQPFLPFLLFYLFTLINVDALLRRLAAELTTVERVPRVNLLRVIREIRGQYSRCRSVAEADVEGRQLAGGGNIVIGMVVIVVFRVADGHAREYGVDEVMLVIIFHNGGHICPRRRGSEK